MIDNNAQVTRTLVSELFGAILYYVTASILSVITVSRAVAEAARGDGGCFAK